MGKGGGNLVPIAVPDICWKNLFFNTKSAIFMISSVSASLCRNLSYCLRGNSRPSVWGILGYSPTASAVPRIALSGTSPKL